MNYDAHFSHAATTMQESAIRRLGALGLRAPDLISFAPGFPAPDVFAWEEFRDIAQSLLSGKDGSVLQYGPTRGFAPLVGVLQEILEGRGIRSTPEELVITTGSQQALDLTARLFVNPGDIVLVELPTYTGAITAFRNAQATLVGVEQDADGVSLDALERAIVRERSAGRRVAFLYLIPNFQNPTGVLLSAEKRGRLLEWAVRHDVLIVEDDPYGALHFEDATEETDTRPIKADDRDGRVVYLSSFSKTVAPGFRVAWVAAPPPIAAKIEVAKQAADLCTGGLDQRIIHQVWKRGVLAARLPQLRAYYQQKRTVMEQALRRELADLVTWPAPRGGFFLWAALPESIDTDALLTRALHHQVVYVAGSAFYVDARRSHCVRLSFSAPTHERIEEGIRRFAVAVREELDAMASPARWATAPAAP
jgi:2-aminoadipate transaminase